MACQALILLLDGDVFSCTRQKQERAGNTGQARGGRGLDLTPRLLPHCAGHGRRQILTARAGRGHTPGGLGGKDCEVHAKHVTAGRGEDPGREMPAVPRVGARGPWPRSAPTAPPLVLCGGPPKGLRCLRGPVSRSAPRACSLPLLLSGALPIFSTVSALEREVTSEVVCSPPHVGSGASARGLPGASRGPFSSPTSASPRPALSSLSRPPVQEEWTLLCPELGTAHTGTWCAGLVGTGRLRITRSS